MNPADSLRREIEAHRRRIYAAPMAPSGAAWRRRLLREWRGCLGIESLANKPISVSETRSAQREGYSLRSIELHAADGQLMPGYLLIPDGARRGATPAALCIHGNVPGAKDEVAGETSSSAARRGLSEFHDDYARQLAQRGVICLVIDQPLQGARTPVGGTSRQRAIRFDASVMAMLATGKPYLGRCATDQLAALTYLLSRPETDRSRVAAVGFSMGGTLAAIVASLDRRVKYVISSGYITSYHERFAAAGEPSALLNYVPGMLRTLDLPQAIALAAPTPMLVVAEARGRAGDERRWLTPIRQAYHAFGASGRLAIWRPPIGPHRFHAAASIPWLMRQFRKARETSR